MLQKFFFTFPVVWAFASGGTLAAAAQSAPAWPAALTLPWHGANMPDSFTTRYQAALTASYGQWRQQWLQGPAPVTGLPDLPPPPRNLRRVLAGVFAGELRDPLGGEVGSITAVPVVCPFGEQTLVVSMLLASQSQRLLGLGARLIALPPRPQFDAAVEPAAGQMLAEALIQASVAAGEQATARPGKADALQLKLSAVGRLTRKDASTGQCLNLLVSLELLGMGIGQVPSLGTEVMGSLQRFFGDTPRLSRATRRLQVAYTILTAQATGVQAEAAVSYSEAVFASNVSHTAPLASQRLDFTVAPGGQQVQVEVPPALLTLLQQEQQALVYKDLPQVSRVERAWVYLDRGRSWGLKMSDRLMAVANPNIKGHVVGFYGPELQIRSPRGYPVHEGAIVYIRKGQGGLAAGAELTFDVQTYPTSWPPEPR